MHACNQQKADASNPAIFLVTMGFALFSAVIAILSAFSIYAEKRYYIRYPVMHRIDRWERDGGGEGGDRPTELRYWLGGSIGWLGSHRAGMATGIRPNV